MRIEVRKSGGETCPQCGANELIYVPAANQHLEADLIGFFEEEAPKHRPLRRASFRRIRSELERACAELRSLSRHEIS